MMKKQNTLTKITSFLMALLMMFGTTSVCAFAATTDMPASNAKGYITVTGLEENATATAYQLITVDYDYTAKAPKSPEFYWVNNQQLRDFVNTEYPGVVNADGSVNTDVLNLIKESTDKSATLYDQIASEIRNGNITLADAGSVKGNGTINNLDMGNYLILIEGGKKVYRANAANIVPTYDRDANVWKLENPEITEKSSTTNIEKKIVTADGEVVKTNASVGDTVKFEITTNIPTYPELSLNSKYVVSDKAAAGLTFGAISKVYGVNEAGQTYELAADAYTTSQARPNSDAVDFALSFDYAKIKAYKQIRIEYTATVNKDAVIGNTGNANTAYLDYSNNPYASPETWESFNSSTTVYSFGFDLTKVDKKTNAALKGAEFEVYSDAELTNKISFVGTNGNYKKADATQTGEAVTTVAVDDSGKLILAGLAEGTYYLKETKAPAEYNIARDAFELTVKDTDNDGVAENADNSVKFENGLVTISIPNSNGFQLPTTGGMGTILFTVGGIALIALGAVMIVLIRKNSKKADAAE